MGLGFLFWWGGWLEIWRVKLISNQIVVEVGGQLLFRVGGWMGGWVVRENESNTYLNSVEVEVGVELGNK